MSEFNAAFDMPTTAGEAQQMLEKWGDPLTATFTAEKARRAARLIKEALNESETADWRENVEYLLKRCPYTLRSREGGGMESLVDSLILTFMRMEIFLKERNEPAR